MKQYCHKLFNSPKLDLFSTVTTKLDEVFKGNKVECYPNTKHNLRWTIERLVTDIKFIHVDGTLYIYPNSLSIENCKKRIEEYIDKISMYETSADDKEIKR